MTIATRSKHQQYQRDQEFLAKGANTNPHTRMLVLSDKRFMDQKGSRTCSVARTVGCVALALLMTYACYEFYGFYMSEKMGGYENARDQLDALNSLISSKKNTYCLLEAGGQMINQTFSECFRICRKALKQP